MDDELRVSLWNALYEVFWTSVPMYEDVPHDKASGVLIHLIWKDFLKRPIDTMPTAYIFALQKLRESFLSLAWNEVYDILEFAADAIPDRAPELVFRINTVLERENSGYRLIANQITPITNAEELAVIQEATTSPYEVVNTHLRTAVRFLADRERPDYRNSIKESISAVESVCSILAGNKKASLTQSLKKLEKNHPIHPALKKGFEHIYGYSSDEEGVRHALLESDRVEFEEAKFMLVACSAFVNYLIALAKD